MRIPSRHVEIGLLEEHLCHSRHTLLSLSRRLGRKIRRNCQFMGCPCLLQESRIQRKNQLPVVQDPLVAGQSPSLLPMLNPICGLHRSSQLAGNREGAGLRSCIGDSSMPCSNLEVHKVRYWNFFFLVNC